MKFRLAFLWFDFWVGGYWDREKRCRYICPLPCCVFIFQFEQPNNLG